MKNLIISLFSKFSSKIVDSLYSRFKKWRQRGQIAKLKSETKLRAAMTASQIDLSGKFSDEILVDELISHLELQDIARDDAIATFLDDETGLDNEAYQFVRDFCSKIDQILSPADNSLASVKTLRIVEESNKDIRALANKLYFFSDNTELIYISRKIFSCGTVRDKTAHLTS